MSFLLGVGTAVLWLCTQDYWNEFVFAKWTAREPWDQGRVVVLISTPGQIRFAYSRVEARHSLRRIFEHDVPGGFRLIRTPLYNIRGLMDPRPGMKRFAVNWSYKNDLEFRSTDFDVRCPMWFALLAFALLPSIWMITHFLGRREKVAGHCPDCGYDLCATPDRCPECGKGFGLLQDAGN